MNLEQSVSKVIQEQLDNGVVEELVAEKFKESVGSALNHLFRSYGDVTKVIEDKIKEVMIPHLEKTDYSEYIVKLDSVLTDVLKMSALENKDLLENFKHLMLPEDRKEITASELFEMWMNHVAEKVDTDDLEVDFDDGPSYENVEVSMSFTEDDSRSSWSIYERGSLTFECEHDEDMNFEIPLSRWEKSSEKGWEIDYKAQADLKSIRYLNDFEILLMRLNQAGTKLVLDTKYENNEVTPNAEPEPTFS